MPPDNPNYLKGAAFGFAAVSIWASWSVITRLAVTTSLDAWDIAALRFGVAGLLLSPVVVRRGLARDRLGSLGLAVIIAGLGAPYALAAAGGLRFAPARDQGALNPGCMPLFVALIAAIVLGEKLSTAQKLGLSLIFAGALTIVGWHAAAWSTSRTRGDALFLLAAFLTACGTVAMRQAKLDPLHEAALVSTGSLVIFPPFYLAFCGSRSSRVGSSGDFPGHPGNHYLPLSLRSGGCHPRRFRWCRLWRFGAGAIGIVCDTPTRRVAK
jgi:drug/metabolite transporter (DMT)-like permease